MLRVCVVVLVLVAGGPVAAEDRADSPVLSMMAFEDRVVASLKDAQEDSERDRCRTLLHQMRNHQAMSALVGELAEDKRPERITYLASGSHMAPLVLCESLPEKAVCRLMFTEISGEVQDGIERFLEEADRVGYVSDLECSPRLASGSGSRLWSFLLRGREVSLQLSVAGGEKAQPQRLITSGAIGGSDLVISHDWSGDPLENFLVIRDFVVAARQQRIDSPPLLMIEDLEAHPYPIDLAVFSPVARSVGPYGHRTADAGIGRHGDVELGESLFGGAVLLGFDDGWWSQVNGVTLNTMFDFLLFHRFDSARQNVLEGGRDPLLAPALLDWWTDFGHRSVGGGDIRSMPTLRGDALAVASRVAGMLEPASRARVACMIELYRSLLEVRAEGGDFRRLMPAARHQRRPVPGKFPSPEMDHIYREALRNSRLFQGDLEAESKAARKALDRFEEQEMSVRCPCDNLENEAAISAEDRYKKLISWLDKTR